MRAIFKLLLAATLSTASGHAAPNRPTWVDDVNVEPPGNTETALRYDFQATELNAISTGFKFLRLELPAGVAAGWELRPSFGVRQRAQEPLQLEHVGGALRFSWAPQSATWGMLAAARYSALQLPEHEHQFRQTVAARLNVSGWLFVSSLSATEGAGLEEGARIELWLGAAAFYELLAPRWLYAGLEAFLLQPLIGTRISDPVFGDSGESATFYAGPSLSVQAHPLWLSAGLATSTIGLTRLTEAGSDVLVRVQLGVQH